jgi:hypothetical protein
MGFADAYLLKAGLREALIEPEPHSGLKICVTIPVYNESGLERCLDSLFLCSCNASGIDFHAEVLILINAPAGAPPEILKQNEATLEATHVWIKDHPHPQMDFHVMLDHSFGKKEAGVGMARKLLMDEAVRRFSLLDRPEGIIAGMDADAVVKSNYLEALLAHFEGDSDGGSATGAPEGCSVRFEHPISGDEFSPKVYEAIGQYELHLRYYLQALRYTGYPYAHHTVGSSFAVLAGVYCLEGGMNRRQGGEDFYFIQKVAQRGRWSDCNSTCVIPSSRPSDRVPFGTGLAVRRLSIQSEILSTYDPRLFEMLRNLFSGLGTLRTGKGMDQMIKAQPAVLQSFLEEQKFEGALEEIRRNSASASAFRKRFWRWFNMFRIMKFLHFARERGYPDLSVAKAAPQMLQMIDPESLGIPSLGAHVIKLLLIYRMLDGMGTTSLFSPQ